MLRMMMLYSYLLSYFFMHYSIIMLFRIDGGVVDKEVKRMNKCLDYTIGPIIWLAHRLGMYVHEFQGLHMNMVQLHHLLLHYQPS